MSELCPTFCAGCLGCTGWPCKTFLEPGQRQHKIMEPTPGTCQLEQAANQESGTDLFDQWETRKDREGHSQAQFLHPISRSQPVEPLTWMPLIVAYNGPINVFSCHFVFRLVMIFSDKWTKKLYCLDKEKEKIFMGCTASTIQALYNYFISMHFYSIWMSI